MINIHVNQWCIWTLALGGQSWGWVGGGGVPTAW